MGNQYRRIEAGKTYEILENGNGDRAIKCTKCGQTSYNPTDVRSRYCGSCHEYHDGELQGDAPNDQSTPR